MKQTNTKPKGATSYKETAFGILPRIKLLQLELEGTKKGLEHIYTLVKNTQDVRITPKIICELHKTSFGWMFPTWAGKYRKIQVTYSDKEAPLYYQIPERITNLCNDTHERLKTLPAPMDGSYITEVVSLLAWFQHQFVWIHPFQDYNGRIARMLTILILLKLNLPPIELKAETGADRNRYLRAMRKADDGDTSLLETLISQALTEALNHVTK